MKNRMYISLLFMLAFLPACNAQENETAKTMLEEFNLKGKVKTVTIIYEQEEKSHKLHFDENGNLVKQENSYVWEGTRGEIHDNYIYENGKLLSYDVHRVFKSPPTLFLGKGCFEYDSRGLLIGSDAYFDDKNVYKYDRKGNRIERYGFLKTRQKHNEKGQIIEEWHFEDKETEVRKFGVTDAQGNHFPDEIHVLPPFELAPNVYEYNEHGDVSGITDMAKSNPVKDIITLKYDEQGNWIERTAHGSAMFNECLTTEQIYTRIFYNHEHIRREIEYYELTADSDTLSRVSCR